MTMSILIPLKISGGRLRRMENLKASISENIGLIMRTPKGSLVADPEYGFIFNNFRFEIFDEAEGVILNTESVRSPMYDKKLSGTSKNVNTFAIDLKSQLDKYEKRLSSVSVSMVYVREIKVINVTVKGIVTETGEDFVYKNVINTWN